MNSAALPPLDGSTVRRVALLIVGLALLFACSPIWAHGVNSPSRSSLAKATGGAAAAPSAILTLLVRPAGNCIARRSPVRWRRSASTRISSCRNPNDVLAMERACCGTYQCIAAWDGALVLLPGKPMSAGIPDLMQSLETARPILPCGSSSHNFRPWRQMNLR